MDQLRSTAIDTAAGLQATWKDADQWGYHARRLAAQAEVAHMVFGDTVTATELLVRAADVPAGYAGYRAPASLATALAFAGVDTSYVAGPGGAGGGTPFAGSPTGRRRSRRADWEAAGVA